MSHICIVLILHPLVSWPDCSLQISNDDNSFRCFRYVIVFLRRLLLNTLNHSYRSMLQNVLEIEWYHNMLGIILVPEVLLWVLY